MITAKVNIKIDKLYKIGDEVPKDLVTEKNKKYLNIPEIRLEDLKIDELKEELDKRDIPYTTRDNKDDLIDKLRG